MVVVGKTRDRVADSNGNNKSLWSKGEMDLFSGNVYIGPPP